MKKFYITTPIYYVNDRPHIGHAYTTIAADVLARYWRRKIGKDNVFFLTGTDEHGTKVAEKAEAEGKTPKVYADEISQLFKEAWGNLGIEYNQFIRTTDKQHKKAVDVFMLKLKESGALYEGTYEGLYCTGCERFYTEKELTDGKCPLHHTVPHTVKEKNWFFHLSDYAERVKEMIESDEMLIEPETSKKETLGLFKQGLEDFSITRESVKWGIPLVFDKKQTIYVWIEALQNYISAIGYGDDEKQFNKWWPADVHLMGRDILKFHAIFWLALLLAVGLKPPQKQFVHGFFSIDGKKMSKSLGNVIDPNHLVDQFGSDATRYLLLSQFPFGQDGDIKAARFKEQYNADLANGFGNLVARTTNMVEKYAAGVVETVERTNDVRKIEKHIEQLEFDQALKEWNKIVTWANVQIDQAEPWKLAKSGADHDKKQLEELLKRLVATIKSLGQVIEPFMPGVAAKVGEQLAAKKITKGEALFPRF